MLEDRITRLEEYLAREEEKILRLEKLAHAIHLSLDQETQKRVADKFLSLMQGQEVNDKQLAEWRALEAKGVKTPLSKAKENLERMKESWKARENPELN